jgi:hypothetical protein
MVALVFYEKHKTDAAAFAATARGFAKETGAPEPLPVRRDGSVWEAADAYAREHGVVVDEIHVVGHIYGSTGPAGMGKKPPPADTLVSRELKLVLHGCVGTLRYDWKRFFAEMPNATAYVHALRTSAGQPFEFQRLTAQGAEVQAVAVADPATEDIGITDESRNAWIAAHLRSLGATSGQLRTDATRNMLGWYGPKVDPAFKEDFSRALLAWPGVKGFPSLKNAAERHQRLNP